MLSDNRIGPEALKTLTAAIATAGSVTELNLSNNNLTASGTDLSGVQASHPSHPLHPLQAAPISLACRRHIRHIRYIRYIRYEQRRSLWRAGVSLAWV